VADIDTVDELVDDLLDDVGTAVVHRPPELLACDAQLGGTRQLRGGCPDLTSEFVAPCRQFGATFRQLDEAGSAQGVGHRAGLEGPQVAVDGGRGLP
jgi:hypothetical protein